MFGDKMTSWIITLFLNIGVGVSKSKLFSQSVRNARELPVLLSISCLAKFVLSDKPAKRA